MAGSSGSLHENETALKPETIDRHLERMAEVGAADRRNGCYTR